MGSPRHDHNRRRQARKCPEPACVQTPLVLGWHTQGGEGWIKSCRGTAQSVWQKHQVRHNGGKARLPAMVSRRYVVRRNRHVPPILEVGPGNRQGWWKRSTLKWDGRKLSLDKTVGSRELWPSQGSRGRPANDLRWWSYSKTASGRYRRSYHSARRRLNVQLGQRRGR